MLTRTASTESLSSESEEALLVPHDALPPLASTESLSSESEEPKWASGASTASSRFNGVALKRERRGPTRRCRASRPERLQRSRSQARAKRARCVAGGESGRGGFNGVALKRERRASAFYEPFVPDNRFNGVALKRERRETATSAPSPTSGCFNGVALKRERRGASRRSLGGVDRRSFNGVALKRERRAACRSTTTR